MSEPRMRTRAKGSQFPVHDLEAMLMAFGDDKSPLTETVRVLDEIVTDFILETAHMAAVAPGLAQRSKIKVDDFKFALRKDPKKLGRVTELLSLDKDIKKKRKTFDDTEGLAALGPGRGRGRRKATEANAAAAAAAAVVGGPEEGGKKKRGRKKKVEEVGSSDGD